MCVYEKERDRREKIAGDEIEKDGKANTAVCIFRSCRAKNRSGSKIFPENSDRSPLSEQRNSVHAPLRSSIRLLFYFFLLLQAFLSAIPSVPIFLSFYIASCAECMNPIFVKVTRGTIAVNRRKAMADLRVSHLETQERWYWLIRKIFIIRNLTRNRKRMLFFILSALSSTPMVVRRIERIIRKSLINSHQNLGFKDFPLNHSLDNRSSSA